MNNWTIRWNFDKESYAPGESALISFWLENTNDTYLYISNLELEFDFGIFNLATIGGTIPPRTNTFLGTVNFLLPENVVGTKIFGLTYGMYEWINNDWVDLGFYTSDTQYFINISPRPFYHVFVSRGLRPEDRMIGDPIAEMIREWCFETVTVGIEVTVPDEQVPSQIREEIRRADAVMAIATPRHRDDLTGLWKTLEWVHDEVGISFGIDDDKPLLILKDKEVSIGGLPSYLAEIEQIPLIEFDPYNLGELRIELSAIMPGLREWAENKRRQEFFDELGRITIGGLAVVGGITIMSGIIGALDGAFKGKFGL